MLVIIVICAIGCEYVLIISFIHSFVLLSLYILSVFRVFNPTYYICHTHCVCMCVVEYWLRVFATLH